MGRSIFHKQSEQSKNSLNVQTGAHRWQIKICCTAFGTLIKESQAKPVTLLCMMLFTTTQKLLESHVLWLAPFCSLFAFPTFVCAVILGTKRSNSEIGSFMLLIIKCQQKRKTITREFDDPNDFDMIVILPNSKDKIYKFRQVLNVQ